jgi:hypothetical protein
MTELLQKAIAEVSKLSDEQQDVKESSLALFNKIVDGFLEIIHESIDLKIQEESL